MKANPQIKLMRTGKSSAAGGPKVCNGPASVLLCGAELGHEQPVTANESGRSTPRLTGKNAEHFCPC